MSADEGEAGGRGINRGFGRERTKRGEMKEKTIHMSEGLMGNSTCDAKEGTDHRR